MKNEKYKIEFLGWDSNFFGLKIGKIEFNKSLGVKELNNLKDLIFQSNLDLIYIFTDISFKPLSFLYKIGAELIDIQLNYKLHIPFDMEDMGNYIIVDESNVNKYVKKEELYKISEQIALTSRFSFDSRIKHEKLLELYRLIVDNSLNKTFGDGLIIDLNDDRKLRGFITFKTMYNYGRPFIIGVDPKYKGKGIGLKIYKQLLHYWHLKNIREVRTVASLKSIVALNFHPKLGFKVVKVNNVFHLWLKKL